MFSKKISLNKLYMAISKYFTKAFPLNLEGEEGQLLENMFYTNGNLTVRRVLKTTFLYFNMFISIVNSQIY